MTVENESSAKSTISGVGQYAGLLQPWTREKHEAIQTVQLHMGVLIPEYKYVHPSSPLL